MEFEVCRKWVSCLLLCLIGTSGQQARASSTGTSAQLAQAANEIIQKQCLACHGATQMSGLDLRQRETILRGGTRGPAAIAGNAKDSLLFKAIIQQGDLKMPPGDQRLAKAKIETLRAWIDEGLPWESATLQAAHQPAWWSLLKPSRPQVPKVQAPGWVRNPIDAFALVKLRENGLTPAPPADKRTLLRRAYFDLIGLPPTPEEILRFLEDEAPDAYEKQIEKLLASPHYGERWGRHWLDVVRYADTSGYETDFYFKNAWRYRDYVIKSFNDDKPYDRFVQEQVAGDELWLDDLSLDGSYFLAEEKKEHLEAHIGTGLHTLGPQVHESNMDGKKLLYERLTDAADTTGGVFMGLTFGCARCHDHKFDPLTQRDYYSFQAIFASSEETNIPIDHRMTLTDTKQHYPRIIALEEARTAYELFEKKIRQRTIDSLKAKFPADVIRAYETPEEKRTREQAELARPLTEAVGKIKPEEQFTPEEREQQKDLYARISQAVLAVPTRPLHGVPFDGLLQVPTATVLGHRNPDLVPEIRILNRGELGDPRENVEPALPAVLAHTVSFNNFPEPAKFRSREMLALWLTQPDHPLTARVMVNRIWQWHFGRGIVDTPNDFGRQGAAPTHPELLDWLATEFAARNWSLKAMHRLLMLSNTYRMASQADGEKTLRTDPDNHYLWRMNRKRLEGEALWDSMLAVSGTLNPKMGGRPVVPPISDDEATALSARSHWPVSADPEEHNRRGIYILVRRNFAFPMFDAFDRPDNSVSCPKRPETTVAPQALWSLNNRTTFRQSVRFASRLVAESGDNPARWVERAWQLALMRAPSDMEKQEALQLVETLSARETRPEDWPDLPEPLKKIPLSRAAALSKLCLAIFNLSEFVYVD